MAAAKDLNRKHKSGISYARAAKKFGVSEDVVRAYAQQAKEFNKQQRAAARAYGYKGDLWKAPSLGDIAKEAKAAERYGGYGQLFKFASENVRVKLADNVQAAWAEKAEQYAANVKQALSNLPEAAFPESNIAKAILAIDNLSPLEVMRITGGQFFDDFGSPTKGTTSKSAPDREGHPVVLALIDAYEAKK